MPLKEKEAPYHCPVNKKTYVALEKEAIKQCEEDKGKGWFLQFEGKPFYNKSAMLIASLFRIIDSWDNQIARMGTEEEIQMKAAVVLSDAENEKKRRNSIEKMIIQYFGNNKIALKEKIDNIITRITDTYRESETTGVTNTKKVNSEELNLEEEVNNLINNNFNQREFEFAKSLTHLYIDACCWEFFKKEQPRHYLKHLYLKNPKISYELIENIGNTKMKHIIKIEFPLQEGKKIKEYCNIFGLNCEKDLPNIQKIIENIADEYFKCNTVESILKERNLEIYYPQSKNRRKPSEN